MGYTFDSPDIRHGLMEARRGGCRVRVFLDKSQLTSGTTRYMMDRVSELYFAGVEVFVCQGPDIRSVYSEVGRDVQEQYGILHAKMFYCGYWNNTGVLVHGSANWTTSSRANLEFCTVTELNLKGLQGLMNWFDEVLVPMATPMGKGEISQMALERTQRAFDRKSRSASRGRR